MEGVKELAAVEKGQREEVKEVQREGERLEVPVPGGARSVWGGAGVRQGRT